MLLKHQLPAGIAIFIILIIALATGALLLHAINSVNFVSVANAE